ncbi:DegQ family serine endoprotease [Desulfovibrio sp. OttesenSCG-928-C14]|nr:DegQ family serine endoprotease [Desulfovibrio sp. OttesenSCG-928-C14]
MKRTPVTKLLIITLLFVFAAATPVQAAFSDFTESVKELPSKVGNAVTPRADFTYLVKQASPAVVNISTERTTTMRPGPFPFGPDFFRGHPFGEEFEFFFGPGPFGGQQGQPRQRKSSSLGSGFIISADGYIVTNNHVVDGADTIKVNFEGDVGGQEKSYEAKVIGKDKETDLALLKIEVDKPLPFIEFGDSDAIQVGEWVLAIGNPFGLDHTVTAGILSAKFRNIDSSSLVRFLQTDASINPGNSGGPLLNMDGEVIGINTAIAAQGQGIGFAIPSTLAAKVISELREDRKVSRGWLGVGIQNVDAATAKALGLPKSGGALIGSVMPGEPAEKAGIEPGDVILKVNGKDIADSDELRRTVASMKPGQTATLQVWRDGQNKSFKIKLAERNVAGSSKDDSKDGKPQADESALGLQLRPLNQQELDRLELDAKKGGLVILSVEPGKLGEQAGLRRGDVILAVGRSAVKSVDDFTKAVKDAGKQGALILRMVRNGQQFFKAIELK